MSLESEIFAKQYDILNKYTTPAAKDKLLVMAAAPLLTPPVTEKAYRDAFVLFAAIFLNDKDQLFGEKPLQLKILEVLKKLCAMDPKNTQYKEQYLFYLMMSIGDHSQELNHDLLPLDLFKQVPLKSIQLLILSQANLPSDWTNQELKNLLQELAINIHPNDKKQLDLARINLVMRYCKSADLDYAREQLLLLITDPTNIPNAAKYFLDYLRTESDEKEIEAIVVMLYLNKDQNKSLSEFYDSCVLRSLTRLQNHAQQSDSNMFVLFSTGGKSSLKQVMMNSLAPAALEEKAASSETAKSSANTAIFLPPVPTHTPPSVPPTPSTSAPAKAPRALPPTPSKPSAASKAKTKGREAGLAALRAMQKHMSGYGAEAVTGGTTAQARAPASERETSSWQSVLADELAPRRQKLKQSDSGSDESYHSDDEPARPAKTPAKNISASTAASSANPLPQAPSSPPAAAAPKTLAQTSSRPSILSMQFFEAPGAAEAKAAAKSPPAAGLTSPRGTTPLSPPRKTGGKH